VTAAGGAAFEIVEGGLILRVRLTPKGGRDALGGRAELAEGGAALAARVSAPPVEGAANKALVRLVAKNFGVPKSAVEILGGETSRLKTLRIAGDPEALAAQAQALLG